MIKTAICDDDKILCKDIEQMIKNHTHLFDDNITIEVFFEGEDIISSFMSGTKYDLIFLDIEMPSVNGIDVGKYIRDELNDNLTQIVYISSKSNYAMQLFENRPLDFLIKPINRENIIKIITLYSKLYSQSSDSFDFTFENNIYKIPLNDIIYFSSSARKVLIHTKENTYSLYGKLSDISNKLENKKFIFTHKSYLINYRYIYKVHYEEIVLTNNFVAPISQANRKKVREQIFKLSKRNI